MKAVQAQPVRKKDLARAGQEEGTGRLLKAENRTVASPRCKPGLDRPRGWWWAPAQGQLLLEGHNHSEPSPGSVCPGTLPLLRTHPPHSGPDSAQRSFLSLLLGCKRLR